MGLAEKNFLLPKFDEAIRRYPAETLLSMIYATHWEWLKNPDDEESRKKGIEVRLKSLYDIFKKDGAGAYGEPGVNISKQFGRQYIIGHDMGIWTGRDLNLSDWALEVASNKISISDYLTRAFLNLFTFIENRYTHILYDICSYMERENKVMLDGKDINLSFGIDVDSIDDEAVKGITKSAAREQASLILNFLSSTFFFDVEKGVRGDAHLLIFAPEFTALAVKNMCNLEYLHKDGEETRDHFSDKMNYANYIAKPLVVKEDQEEITYVIEPQVTQTVECELRSDTIQKIIYGPPGIGKSYSVTDEIKVSYKDFSLESDNPFLFRTTLHPEYSYNDFVGQIMPVVKENAITYEFTPGIFTQALDKAIKSKENDVYLVLEEMSRANVAAIFGDLFQLLDRVNGVSEYKVNHDLISNEIYKTNQKISLPKNLHLIGTVNTSDQNVYVMDTAFKRRFDFEYISLKPISKNGKILNKYTMTFINSNEIIVNSDWIDFYQSLNSFIVKELKLSEDKQVGQFFIKFSQDDEKNKKTINNKLLQYLWQDIHQVSFVNISLFQPSIQTFSEAYESLSHSFKTNEPIKIFSDNFLDVILKLSVETSDE